MPETILFQAVNTPPRSFSGRGFCVLAGLLALAAAAPAALFWWLGAWPVLGFMGGEMLLVLGLILLHSRWSARMAETVLLTPSRLLVRHTDRRGHRREAVLEPYWARVAERQQGGLVLISRGRAVEIGRHLAPDDKRAMAAALTDALHRFRRPDFDNAQLR